MTKDEALRLALEALEDLGMKHYENTGEVLYKETFTAIKAALEAKDEPKDGGWTHERIAGMERLKAQQDSRFEPQRTWVGLTYKEESDLIRLAHNHAGIRFYIQAAEAKLKDKNI